MKTSKLKKVIVKAPNEPARVMDAEINLAFLQAQVGGDVERRRLMETGCFAWCNENGTAEGLEPTLVGPWYVLGTVVITGGDTPAGNSRGLTPKQIDNLLAIING